MFSKYQRHGTFRPVNVLQVQWHTRGDAWQGGIHHSVLEYSRVLHNVCMTGKLTQCVTSRECSILRAQQKMMQSQIYYKIFIVNRY